MCAKLQDFPDAHMPLIHAKFCNITVVNLKPGEIEGTIFLTVGWTPS
jgi:hypothetical protein